MEPEKRQDLPGPPPFERMHARLLELADALEQGGDGANGERLRALVDECRTELEAWSGRVEEVLAVHHEINNALVGVRGNTQLMLMNPAGQGPGVRERLEVVLRESGRIQEATIRLRDLKGVFGRRVPRPHAA